MQTEFDRNQILEKETNWRRKSILQGMIRRLSSYTALCMVHDIYNDKTVSCIWLEERERDAGNFTRRHYLRLNGAMKQMLITDGITRQNITVCLVLLCHETY